MKSLPNWLSRKYLILLGLVSFFVILDQVTKQAVVDNFYLYQSKPVIQGFFDLTYVRNTGAAFGLLAKAPEAFRVPFFLFIPFLALFLIGMLFRKLPAESIKLSVALSLVISGALGNLIDRIRFGYVVDFLLFHLERPMGFHFLGKFWRFYAFPAFNVADIVICVGVGLLILDIFTTKQLDELYANEPKAKS